MIHCNLWFIKAALELAQNIDVQKICKGVFIVQLMIYWHAHTEILYKVFLLVLFHLSNFQYTMYPFRAEKGSIEVYFHIKKNDFLMIQ